MLILSIDTSGQTASAAITDGCITLGECSAAPRGKLTHSEILMPMIDGLFRYTGLALRDIDYIACVSGPGSFTGLRVGAATALGLASGLKRPVIAVPALDALAYNVGCTAGEGVITAPMMDARRSQVYTAVYRSDGEKPARVSDYMAVSVRGAMEILSEYKSRVIVLGDGAAAYEAELKNGGQTEFTFAPPHLNRQRASSSGVCALRMIEGGFSEEFKLLYIRKPQAERALLGEV